MSVQNRWETSPGPLDPHAVKLRRAIVNKTSVGSIEPDKDYPEHTVLVFLDSSVVAGSPVVIKQASEALGPREPLVLRPADAQQLARSLLAHVEELERDAEDAPV